MGYVTNAQNLIKFVFTNLGRLEVLERIKKGRLEQKASTQSQPSSTPEQDSFRKTTEEAVAEARRPPQRPMM